jgi:hypothetical protein
MEQINEQKILLIMAVYREGYHAIKSIESESLQIYPDACDYGAPCKKGDNIWNLANLLANWYGDKSTKQIGPNKTSTNIRVTLIDEWAVSDERKTIKEATDIFDISFVKCTTGKCKNFDGFVCITKIN